jgi:F-type H+-transporting ATPase subunit gamma
MPSLKEYKAKLNSLQNMRKITRTMKMVAASKLTRTMSAQRQALLFSQKLRDLIGRLAAGVEEASHPLLRTAATPEKALVLLYTSDRGLCGSFNNNLLKSVWRWMQAPERRGRSFHVSYCGRRGFLAGRKRLPVKAYYEGVTVKPDYADAARIASEVCRSFLEGEFDEVYLAYNHFLNPLSQKPQIEQLLPLGQEVLHTGERAPARWLVMEPPETELLTLLVPKIVEFQIYFALLENAAGENGARMTAMDNATSNAASLIDRYTLLRNRARQASITKELIEIVSGAEAL